MADTLPKGYEPHDVEARWRDHWQDNRTFTPDPDAQGEPFSIVIPPPNITGQLHMGHALDETLQDILIRYKNMKQIYGYKMKEYWSNIATVESYYQTNMDFLKPEVRKYFFHDEPKIYSKVDDLPPAKYNIGSDVRNSLIASGCIVNSKVENSILFKKVFVGKNCVIKNSIILNDVYIGDNTHIENCIVESRDTLKANTYYCGDNGIRIVSENNERYVL